jgi:hypothetical protein
MATEPSRPAWFALVSMVCGALTGIVIGENLAVSANVRACIELGTAAVAIGGVLVWVQLNRTALLERERGAKPRAPRDSWPFAHEPARPSHRRSDHSPF